MNDKEAFEKMATLVKTGMKALGADHEKRVIVEYEPSHDGVELPQLVVDNRFYVILERPISMQNVEAVFTIEVINENGDSFNVINTFAKKAYYDAARALVQHYFNHRVLERLEDLYYAPKP